MFNFYDLYNRLPIDIRNRMKNCKQDIIYHPEGDVETHTMLVFNCLKKYNDINLLISAIFHDIGKPDTQVIKPRNNSYMVDIENLPLKDLKISNINHEELCEDYIDKYIHLFNDLDLNIDKIKQICKYHTKAHLFADGKIKKKSKINKFKSLKYFNDIMKFEKCDNLIKKL